MASTSPCCTSDHAIHVAKGTGYCLATTGCSLALAGVAVLVAAIAVGLLAWDGIFVYSIGMRAPLHLIWAIPVTLAFVAVDLLIILSVIQQAGKASRCLLGHINHSGAEMTNHFRLICPGTD